MSLQDIVLGFLGGGNMAKALVEGVLNKGLVKSSQIIVSRVSKPTLEGWKALAVNITTSNIEVVEKADIVFLTFKPYQLDHALQNLNCSLPDYLPSRLFVSVLAGVKIEAILETLRSEVQLKPRLIRVMPNMPTVVGEGCAALAPSAEATERDIKMVQMIFLSVGKCEIVPEQQFSAITGLAGSGPAYIFMMIEALSDGGVKQGLPRGLATTFAAQTVMGAAKMVLETNKHPAVLKDEVCSAGGTTIYGVHALEKGGLRSTFMNAVEAAALREKELGALKKD